VPLSKETIQAFQRVINSRPKIKSIEVDGHSGFVFINPKGNPKVAIDYNALFIRMVKKYNKHHKDNPLPHITPHTGKQEHEPKRFTVYHGTFKH